VRREMSEALTLLDGSLPKNPHVKILQKGHGWIALSSLDAQPEPVNLSELKSEIQRCGAKSKKASTSSRLGTGPTASSSTAKAVRSLLTTWRTRSSLCWRFTCCRSALSTLTH
jgi:hypothetical protein